MGIANNNDPEKLEFDSDFDRSKPLFELMGIANNNDPEKLEFDSDFDRSKSLFELMETARHFPYSRIREITERLIAIIVIYSITYNVEKTTQFRQSAKRKRNARIATCNYCCSIHGGSINTNFSCHIVARFFNYLRAADKKGICMRNF